MTATNTLFRLIFLSFNLLLISGCDSSSPGDSSSLDAPSPTKLISNASRINDGLTINERFRPPKEYKRIDTPPHSYAFYLSHLPLKEKGSPVMLYDGTKKYNQNVSAAVVDLEIGDNNLHQCADAIMRLRADYLRKNKKFEQIHFNLTNGMEVGYSQWIEGHRVNVDGNKTEWVRKAEPSDSDQVFWDYMEFIFMYAGTLSLSKELRRVDVEDMQIGDIFIVGGSPGHAIVVVDMAKDKEGRRVFMLAQSYMPAQDLHVLVNPSDKSLSPWYNLDFGKQLITPEWQFTRAQLKRFPAE